MKKEYLGDSVYIEVDANGQILLTTNNGYMDDPRNKIYLDQHGITALKRYIAAWENEQK